MRKAQSRLQRSQSGMDVNSSGTVEEMPTPQRKAWGATVLMALLVFLLTMPTFAWAQGKAPSEAKRVIKIGWIGPLSGVSGEDGSRVLRGTKLAFGEVNWEIGGRKIELLVEDSAMNPAVALAKLKKLYHDNKIDILIGPYSSASGLAIRDFFDSNKLLTVSPQAAVASLTEDKFSKYFFRTWNASGQIAPFEGWLLAKLGYRSVTFFAPDFSAGHDQIEGIKKAYTKFGGKVLDEVYFPMGKTMDFAPLLAKIDVDKPDAVYVWAFGGDAVRFVKQYADYGYKKRIPLITGTAVADNFLQAQGDAALGVYMTYWYGHTLDTPENLRFKKLYAEVYGAEKGKLVTPYDEQGYLAGKIVVFGIQAVKGNVEDVDGMIKAIEKMDIEAPRGPFKFYKHNGVFNNYLWQVNRVNGRLLNTVLKAYGPIRQGWFQTGQQIAERPVPGK